jgi:tetratricopeptide (TPR) repeat protein
MDVKLDFAVTNENAPAVAEICTRLDGLPLAIELAAARIKLFTPQALLARLEQPLALLTGGARDLPARQQTLRNTIAWSYNLLDAGEQSLFARLGIFVGGCTIEAAAAVCNTAGDLPFDMLDGLAAIVDKSLLRYEEGLGGDPRFVMLETVREYALERLEASGELEALARQHAQYFLALAEGAEATFGRPQQVVWLGQLEQEHDNLRAALQWALKFKELKVAGRLGSALSRFWEMHSHTIEGYHWLGQVLAIKGTMQASLRAKVLLAAGQMASTLEDCPRDRVLLQESLTLYRAVEDKKGIAWALDALGAAEAHQANYKTAQAQFEEALAIRREIGDKWGTVITLHKLAVLARHQHRGDFARARTLLQECLALRHACGDQQVIALVLYELGLIARLRADIRQAKTFFQEALVLYRELGNKRHTARMLSELGEVAGIEGNYVEATVLCEESITLRQETGIPFHSRHPLRGLGWAALAQGDYEQASARFTKCMTTMYMQENTGFIANCLFGLARVANMQAQLTRAARLCGAAAVLWSSASITHTLFPDEHATHEQIAAAVRVQLDEATFTTAWAEGQAMTLEQAIAEALGGDTTTAVPSR